MRSGGRRPGAVSLLITLSGVDCAGKSTQLDLLRTALEGRGRRVVVMWHRPGYSLGLQKFKALIRSLSPGALPTAGPSPARDAVFSRPGVSRAWVIVALLDMLIQYGIKIRVSLLRGRDVVADRYVADGLLDLRLRFPSMNIERWLLTRMCKALCPAPDQAFLLVLSPEETSRRMAAKNEPFPDAEAVRESRRRLYHAMAAASRFTVIDAGRTPDVVHGEIMSHLRSDACK